MEIARYDPGRDRPAIERIWHDTGWVNLENQRHAQMLEAVLTAGRGLVARLDGEAECLVTDAPGTLRYLEESVPFSGITSVATGHVARKRGLAGRTTARLVAGAAEAGALVATLGVFDQGFYNRLGFGSGPYERVVHLNPKLLQVPVPAARVVRLTDDDWEDIHACRMARRQAHGALTFSAAQITRADMFEPPQGWGLGFAAPEDGRLTHMLWLRADNREEGPYEVGFMACRDREDLLEVLGLIKSLEDQVSEVCLAEPPGVQLQDLVARPHQSQSAQVFCEANWQLRILDLPRCLSRTHLPCDELRFNLALSDPIAGFLSRDDAWKGIAGDYVVSLGRDCSAEAGAEPGLPALSASVAAFTRLWYGVRPATGLAITDDLAGPPELLAALDDAFRLPAPTWDWQF
jgi:predicted acetyltransferase